MTFPSPLPPSLPPSFPLPPPPSLPPSHLPLLIFQSLSPFLPFALHFSLSLTFYDFLLYGNNVQLMITATPLPSQLSLSLLSSPTSLLIHVICRFFQCPFASPSHFYSSSINISDLIITTQSAYRITPSHLLLSSQSNNTILDSIQFNSIQFNTKNCYHSDEFDENFLLAVANSMHVTPLPQKVRTYVRS